MSVAISIVVGVMKMGNIVSRAELKPTSLAFRARVLPLHHIGFPDVTTIPIPTYLCGSLPQRSEHTTTLTPLVLSVFYCLQLQVVTIHKHTQGRFNNHTAHSLYRIMLTETSVVGMKKMGNILPRANSNPHLWHSSPLCYHYTT